MVTHEWRMENSSGMLYYLINTYYTSTWEKTEASTSVSFLHHFPAYFTVKVILKQMQEVPICIYSKLQ